MPEPEGLLNCPPPPLSLILILVTFLFWNGLGIVKIEMFYKIMKEKVCMKPTVKSEDGICSQFNSIQKYLPSTCILGWGGCCGNPYAESKSRNVYV